MQRCCHMKDLNAPAGSHAIMIKRYEPPAEEEHAPATCVLCQRPAAIFHAGIWKCWYCYDKSKCPDWRDLMMDERVMR